MCQLGKVGCWGKYHPTLCERARIDQAFADAMRQQPEHPDFGPVEDVHHVVAPHELDLSQPRMIRPWRGPKVRLGLASPDLQIGGVAAWMLDLINATSSAPFEWAGIAVRKREQTYAPVVNRFQAVLPVSYGQDAIYQLARDVDILIGWGLGDLHRTIGQAAGCRTLLVSHGVCDWTEAVMKEAIAATACAAVVGAAAERFPESERSRVRVIRNTAAPHAPTMTRAEVLESWGVPADKKVVGYLGRIAVEKYPEAVVKAVAELPDEWVGVLVGPWGEYLDQVVAELGVEHRIYRPGPTSSPANALEGFDCLMLASIADAHSIALTESWLAGVPVIATAIGITEDHPWLVRVVPQKADGATLARAIVSDQIDPAGTLGRIVRARHFAQAELSPEHFAEEWRAYLLEIVSSTAAGQDASTADTIRSEPPSFARKVFNFGKALVEHIATGAEMVDDATAAARLAVCTDCWLFDAATETCNHKSCGCQMPRKVRWKEQRCPLGKWPDVAA